MIRINAEKDFVPSITEIFKTHNEEIYRYFLIRTARKEIAEDLTSEVFVKFIQTKESYDSTKSSIRTWLYIISRGILINHFNKENLRKHEGPEFIEHIASESVIEKEVDFAFVIEAINKLEETDRDLLTLRYVNDLAIKEIAQILNINYLNTKIKLFRSLNKLKKIING